MENSSSSLSETTSPLSTNQAYPKCAGMGLLWLCISALIVLPILVGVSLWSVLPGKEEWMECAADEERMAYFVLRAEALAADFFFSLWFYFPWLLLAYGVGVLCSRFWLRALWVVLFVACGALLLGFILWVPLCTIGSSILQVLPFLLLIMELYSLLSYLLPYWLTCKRAARGTQVRLNHDVPQSVQNET